MSAFDPNKSKVSADKLAEFLAAPLEEDITMVPGIGDMAAKYLETDNVTTTFQLIGIFLTLKGKDMTPKQHLDAFWFYLQDIGINSYRSGIVQCIAEKTNIMIPGIYTGLEDE